MRQHRLREALVIGIVFAVFFSASRADGQSCPMLNGVDSHVARFDFPPDNLPIADYYVQVTESGLISLISTAIGSADTYLAPFLTQVYGYTSSFDPEASLFTKQVKLVMNRRRQPDGSELVRLARFGASSHENNFLFTLVIKYLDNGRVAFPVETSCTFAPADFAQFNKLYLNLGPSPIPLIKRMPLDNASDTDEDFHNALVQSAGTVKQSIEQLMDAVSGMQTELGSLQNELGSVSVEASNLKVEFTTLSQKVNELATVVADYQKQSQTVTQIGTSISGLGTNLANLGKRIDSIQAAIVTLKKQLAKATKKNRR
jgi:hypothetical protein